MRLSKNRGIVGTGFDMTPMIDIVFLLIIFFMTVSQITRVNEHPVELPQIEQGGEATDPITMTINVDQKGLLIVSGKEYDLPELVVLLGNQLEELEGQPERLKVRVRLDRKAKMGIANRLIQELESLGINQVRFSIRGVH